MTMRRGISSIIAMLLMISLAVFGSAVYFAAVTSYFRPQGELSSQVSISAGASGFTIISTQVVNTGGMPFASITVTITGPASQLRVIYTSLISVSGGSATFAVRGVSGGPYTAISSNTGVSGNLQVDAGSTYTAAVVGTMTSGATYGQAFSVHASP